MSDSFASNFEDDFGLETPAASKAKQPVDPRTSAHPTAPTLESSFARAYPEKCPKCRGTGRFVSWAGRDLGQCHKCKGKGEIVFKTSASQRAQSRATAADRKARAQMTALETFAAQHPAEWAWIEGSRATFEFAQSIHDAIAKYGSLTERQLAACTRAAEKAAQRQADRAAAQQARLEAAPVVSMDKMLAAFAAASQTLQNPKLRMTGGLEISPAKATSTNAGFLYVKTGDLYLGKISPEGKFLRSRDCSDAHEQQLVAIAADPLAAAVAYGRETGTCSCCARELTNPLSIELGIGPICREKFGWGV